MIGKLPAALTTNLIEVRIVVGALFRSRRAIIPADGVLPAARVDGGHHQLVQVPAAIVGAAIALRRFAAFVPPLEVGAPRTAAPLAQVELRGACVVAVAGHQIREELQSRPIHPIVLGADMLICVGGRERRRLVVLGAVFRPPGLALTPQSIEVPTSGAIQRDGESIVAFIVFVAGQGIPQNRAVLHVGADIVLRAAGNLLHTGL